MWQKQFVQPPEDLPPQDRHDRFDSEISGMRVHELAVQRWLNHRFLVAAGYPMPVLFTKPMSAYADFRQYWQQSGPSNPFAYLLQAKDKQGKPLYQPHPAAPAYPLLTINRLSWKFAPQRNFGYDWFRHGGWLSVSKDVTRQELGEVRQTRMPQAWDYRLQIDHYCVRPDSQANFIQELQQGFFPSASVPNTWIKAAFPGILGLKLVRVLLDGDINDATEEEPVDGYRVFRTTINVIVEGWLTDPDYLVVPALWKVVGNVQAVPPDTLGQLYSETVVAQVTKEQEENGIFNTAPNMPVQ
jgi:hypothetical protein